MSLSSSIICESSTLSAAFLAKFPYFFIAYLPDDCSAVGVG